MCYRRDMKADMETETEIIDILNKLANAYTKRDTRVIEALVASDPDVVLYGTGTDEKRIGLDQIKAKVERDWSQSEATSITYEWTSISSSGSVAWVASDATFHIKADGTQMKLPARVTLVLEKRNDRWLVVQGHFSFPAESQSPGQSFPKK